MVRKREKDRVLSYMLFQFHNETEFDKYYLLNEIDGEIKFVKNFMNYKTKIIKFESLDVEYNNNNYN